MTFALGVLRWSPETFWASTFYEVSCAYMGHLIEQGAFKQSHEWTKADVDEIEALKKRFPDEVPIQAPAEGSDGGT